MRGRDYTAREKLAMDLHGAHKHLFGGQPAHPQANEWAWDELPSRSQDRWLAVVDTLLQKHFRQRVQATVAAEARDTKDAA